MPKYKNKKNIILLITYCIFYTKYIKSINSEPICTKIVIANIQG